MNIYAHSVALLWTTALSAPGAGRTHTAAGRSRAAACAAAQGARPETSWRRWVGIQRRSCPGY